MYLRLKTVLLLAHSQDVDRPLDLDVGQLAVKTLDLLAGVKAPEYQKMLMNPKVNYSSYWDTKTNFKILQINFPKKEVDKMIRGKVTRDT